MENFDLSWILVGLSLAGNIFVIKKNVIGQWMWAISNLGWIAFNINQNLFAPAFLFAVYFAMCVWGIISWSKESSQSSVQKSSSAV